MLQEKALYEKAYGRCKRMEKAALNDNQRVSRGLSAMIVKIWQEWKADTRHFQPAQRDYERYKDIVSRGEALLDPQLEGYEEVVEAVAECKRFLTQVVLFGVRKGGCRVF